MGKPTGSSACLSLPVPCTYVAGFLDVSRVEQDLSALQLPRNR
jgi:hypothetical protein